MTERWQMRLQYTRIPQIALGQINNWTGGKEIPAMLPQAPRDEGA
jgi:hypothetical protein